MKLRRWMLWGTITAMAAALGLHVAYGLGYLWYSAPDSPDEAFDSHFEKGSIEEWSQLGARQFCCPHSVAVVDDIVRSGSHAARITLSRSDPDMRGSKRAEFRLKAVPMGSVYRYAFSVYLPADWQADPIPVTIAQWHAVPDKILFEGGRSPPLRLAVKDEEWAVVAHWDPAPVAPFLFQRERADKHAVVWRGPIERGRWIDWELTVHWSHGDDGRVRLRKDSVVVADRKGPVGYNDFLAPYFKLGLYVPDWAYPEVVAKATRRTIYVDDISVGAASFRAAPRPVGHVSSLTIGNRGR